jgi:tetratricopeptide (TPR) repeat protein
MKNRKWIVGGALAVVVGIVLGAGGAYAQSADEFVLSARQLIDNRQFEAALQELDRALEEDENHASAHYLKGIALGNLGREREALDEFVLASELNPGWADAHRWAAVAALNTRNLDIAWDQAIKAHQAGVDMSQELSRLLTMERAPEDLDLQLDAARVFVMPLDTEKLSAREDNPWSVDVVGGGGGGGVTDPFNTSATRATNVGDTQITQSQSDFFNLLTQTRRSLADSKLFGVVPRQEMADFLLVIEVDRLGDTGQKTLEGYLKLYDPRSGEEVYRRVLELRNISSLADLNADLERYIDYMEQWLRERVG